MFLYLLETLDTVLIIEESLLQVCPYGDWGFTLVAFETLYQGDVGATPWRSWGLLGCTSKYRVLVFES